MLKTVSTEFSARLAAPLGVVARLGRAGGVLKGALGNKNGGSKPPPFLLDSKSSTNVFAQNGVNRMLRSFVFALY